MFKRIGVTGDTHGDLMLTRFKKAVRLGYDALIVAGDFGYLWDGSKKEKEALIEISKLNITILFVSGNRENFHLLKQYPTVIWNGGKVQFIQKNIIHLLRGQVFNINDKKIFTFGGAKSVDKFMRKELVDWWSEEMPSKFEMENGINSLELVKNNVDYIISHTCATELLEEVVRFAESDELTQYFSFIRRNINYNHWFFGHMHVDLNITSKDSCLYKNIKELN